VILVGGGSWANGEWGGEDPPHRGLAQYMTEKGLAVENLGYHHGQNTRTIGTFRSWFDTHQDIQVEKIFVFQTDYTCDFLEPWSWQHIKIHSVDTLQNFSLQRFYTELSGIARQNSCTVHVIGGMSDAQDPDEVAQLYPGVVVACQSMVNLLINNQARIKQPVFGWYTTFNLKLFKYLKSVLDYKHAVNLLDRIELSMQRERDMADCQQYFWPDRLHPNRLGHKKLFDYLCEQGYIQ
jgi:hypothetical protein